jgi:RNA polymerase sigma factor (sigma-70 family)
MVAEPAGAILRHLRRLVETQATHELTDGQLLRGFAVSRDEGAFAALLQRHAPLVWRVCRHVLGHEHDAEDAFQATFLVLARRAAAIRKREAVASWLHGVAYRIAVRARCQAAKRLAQERRSALPETESPSAGPAVRELQALLDEELQRLAEKYRAPFVLCCLEGWSRAEAAAELGWPVGTVSSRIAQARRRLQQRLTRRGVTLSATLTAGMLWNQTASAAAPAPLIQSTVKAALRVAAGQAVPTVVTPAVAVLLEGGFPWMSGAKLKIALALLLTAGFIGSFSLAVGPPSGEQAPPAARQPKPEDRKPLADRQGDPLPAGALTRLGTLRWRARGEVAALAVAPDGKTVAAAAYGKLSLFDAATGKLTKSLRPPDSFLRRIAFSPDGTRLAGGCTVEAAGRPKGVVCVWESAGERQPQTYDAEHLIWLGWSADGEPLAVCLEPGALRLHELAAGRSRRFACKDLRRPELSDYVVCTCAPVGRALAVADERNVIHVWDTTTSEKRCTLRPETTYVRSLAVSPDGRDLASLIRRDPASSEGQVVQIWDTSTGKVRHTVAVGQSYLDMLAFRADGRTLATVGWNDVRLWDVATGRERARASGVHSFAEAVAFTADGKILITAERHSGTLHLWDVATGTLKPEYPGHTNRPGQIAFSPEGRRLATAGNQDGTILVWDPLTAQPLAQVRRDGWVRACAFSTDGRTLYSSWTDDKLHFSDAASGRDLHVLKLEDPSRPDTQQGGMYMYLSDDGKTLVALSHYESRNGGSFIREYLVTGWDTATRRQRFRRSRAFAEFNIAVSPDARLLAASQGGGPNKGGKVPGGQGPMRLEELATGELILTFPVLEGQTWPLAFSPDGRLMVSYTNGPAPGLAADGDRPRKYVSTLRLWEVATATELLTWATVPNARIAFSPDGRVLALSAPSQEIQLWDLRRGEELRRLKGFEADVTSLAFSPEGNRLVSGLSDSTLLVWDVAPSRPARKPGNLDAAGAARQWARLAADARVAFAARVALASLPERVLPLLKKRLRPVRPAEAQQLRQLLADLDSDRFAVREAAQKELAELAELAAPALRQALTVKPSLEQSRRIQALLEKLRGPVTRPETLREIRAVAVLEDLATPEARTLLETLAQGAPPARLTLEAEAALKRLKKRPAAAP